MTARAVIVGLLLAMLLTGVAYINDRVLGLESLGAGHLIPVSVYGVLILLMVLVIPVLHLLWPKAAMRPAEIGVIVVLLLAGCSIPGRGLMEQFTGLIAMPAHWNTQNPGWRERKLMGYVPHGMLVNDGKFDNEVMSGFQKGLGTKDEYIGLDRVPWGKWWPALSTWLPLIVLMGVCSVCMGLIVHRQWTTRERLRYPIAGFATSILQREDDRAIGPIFRNRMFWIGLGVVLAVRVINGLNAWFPDRMVQIPLYIEGGALAQKYPLVSAVPNGYGRGILSPTLYPIAVAFSFFLASDISLSMGLTQYILVPFLMILMVNGYDIATGSADTYMAGDALGWQRFGSYLAYAIIVLYTGRRYYGQLLKQAVTFRQQENVESYAAWACRVLIVAIAMLLGLIIVGLGLEWTLAVPMVLLMLMMFMCVSRISAETGLFFIQPRWQPMGVFLGLFGIYALGPQAIIVTGLLCAVLSLDPSQALMPFLVNGLKINEDLRIKPARTGWTVFVTFLLCLAVGLPVVLWANYNWGLRQEDWAHRRVPSMAFNPAEMAATKLKSVSAKHLEDSENLGAVQRVLNMAPDPTFVQAATFGFAMVLLFSFLRLRFSWWPLHPVMFLLWATWPMHAMGPSFLLGWGIKTAVTKVGGSRTYHQIKPLMVGFIAGDLLGAAVFMAAGGIYYYVTGLPPITYTYFPR